MKAHLIVELEDLPSYRYNGIFHAVKLIPGVVMVCHLESISRDTLDQFLGEPLPADLAPAKPKRRKGRAAA